MRNDLPTFRALGNNPFRTQRVTVMTEIFSNLARSVAVKNFFMFYVLRVIIVSIDSIIAQVKNSGNGDNFFKKLDNGI